MVVYMMAHPISFEPKPDGSSVSAVLNKVAVRRLSDAELVERLEELRPDDPVTATQAGLPPLATPPLPPAVPAISAALDGDPLKRAEAADRTQQALELVECLSPSSPERRDIAADAAAHRLIEIAPRDPVEQMLTTQMLALHAAVMDCARRAMIPGQDGGVRREELGLATKASRAFAQLADTLDRRRRGGEQKMIVEHVHVHSGGQAIVGPVSTGGGSKNGE